MISVTRKTVKFNQISPIIISSPAPETMACFAKLPTELLLMIADLLDPPPLPVPFVTNTPSSPADLASLSRVNRRLHSLFTNDLYNRHGLLAVPWACQKPSLATLKALLRESESREWALACLTGPIPLDLVLQNNTLVKLDDIDHHDWRQSDDADALSVQWSATPLHLACGGGHDDIVEFLLDYGASMEAASDWYCECLRPFDYPWTSSGLPTEIPRWRPLHHALCGNHTSTALLLLKKGAAIIVNQGAESPSVGQVTALHMAAAYGLDAVARYLITLWGQDPARYIFLSPDQRGEDRDSHSPMHYLALNHDYDSVGTLCRILQAHGIEVNPFEERWSCTPLVLACRLGNFPAASALIKAGANPHFTDPEGDNCMKLALMADYWALDNRRQSRPAWELSRLQLIKDLVGCNALSRFPLSEAAHCGHFDELKFLLNSGFSHVNQVDDDNMTPLAHAAQQGNVEMVEFLLAAGASVTHFHGSITAVSICADNEPVRGKHAAILEMLLKHGANIGFCSHRDNPIERKEDYSGSVLDDAMWRIEVHPRFGDGRQSPESTFGFILQHSNPFNFPKACWEQAVSVLFDSDDMKVSRASGIILHQLLQFGARSGYVFDDEMLCTLLGLLIERGHLRDLNSFFSMGSLNGVRGETGLITRQATLVLAMANFHLNVFKWKEALGVIRYLLEQLPTSAGKVGYLGNATLLHLGCCTGDAKIVQTILDYGIYSPHAVWCSMTPLMVATGQKKGSIHVIRLLLSRGADPYFKPGTIGGETNGLELPDFLNPRNEHILSSRIRAMLNLLLERHQEWVSHRLQAPVNRYDEGKLRPARRLSAFELAIIDGRSDFIEEFLKYKPFTELPVTNMNPDSPESYLGLALVSHKFQCFQVLVKAGANINADRECPLLPYQLDLLLLTQCMWRSTDPIDLDWLGRQVAILVMLLKAGADYNMKSHTFAESFKDVLQKLASPNDEITANNRILPLHNVVGAALCDAFTLQRPDPRNRVVTLKINLEGTEEWLDPSWSRNSEDWFNWPASWRDWKAKWSRFQSGRADI
ncbi:ankyrin repeat-containing domain protein [Podospora fimiseda]|uniref:Ankyrin repeat-containing domain protein n=1 Tax=Podospora fimiseda TaxID=252190 RepID=A0AAN6YPG9_9PEZI|nr:ankyrin repeat-containing domain protein [Podospora fimiseda]